MIDRRTLLRGTAGAAALGTAAAAAAPLKAPRRAYRLKASEDGLVDAAAAIGAIGARGPVRLAAGRHRIATSLALPAGLIAEAGAVLQIEDVTLAIGGFLDAAARTLLFDCRGDGRVVFLPGTIIEGYPEWWGARSGVADFDCLPALSACLAACETMRLAAADYFIGGTLKATVPNRRIQGSGWFGVAAGSATRIILTGARAGTDTVLQVGPDQMPASIPDYGFAIGISDLVLDRTKACVPPPGGEETLAACALQVRWVVQARIERVAAIESSIGFYLHDCVYTKLIDCFTQRYNPGTLRQNDIMRGFYADGRRKSHWFSGGNASVYMERCNVTGSHPAHVDAIALKASGAFCDLFIDRFETSNVPKGCVFEGEGTPNPDAGNIDVHIRGAILDGCTGLGLELHAGPPTMTVQLVDVYVALAGDQALAGIAVLDGGGTVSILGGEVHGAATQASLWVLNQTGVQCAGLKLRDTPRPVLLDRARHCDLQVAINNPSRDGTAPAVRLIDSPRNYVRPTVIGRPRAFPAGVVMSGADSIGNEIVTTLIDPAAIASSDKILIS